MRTKLKELGVGSKIFVYGQYKKVGGHATILLTDIFNLDTKDYLCDHLWLDKCRVPRNKEHNDFVVVNGTVCEYQKLADVDYVVDYSVIPIAVWLIKPFVFHNTIVYMQVSEKYQTNYWFYKGIKGFDSETESYGFETDEILHLYTGFDSQTFTGFDGQIVTRDAQKGYEIINETADYYDLYYEKRGSNLRVYKSLDKALSHIKEIEWV